MKLHVTSTFHHRFLYHPHYRLFHVAWHKMMCHPLSYLVLLIPESPLPLPTLPLLSRPPSPPPPPLHSMLPRLPFIAGVFASRWL